MRVNMGLLAIERKDYRLVVSTKRFCITFRDVSFTIDFSTDSFRFVTGTTTLAYGTFCNTEMIRFVSESTYTYRFEHLGTNEVERTYGLRLSTGLDVVFSSLIRYDGNSVTIDD